jgi:ElaB/YqjD/DUF883 family membrane-anchored ribosome-binding protein
MNYDQEFRGPADTSAGEGSRSGNGAGSPETGPRSASAGYSSSSGTPGYRGDADARGADAGGPALERALGVSGAGNGRPGINWREGTSQTRQPLAHAKDRIADTVIAAQDRSSAMLHASCGYIQRYPFRSVAIAGVVGVLVGVMLGSRTGMQQLLGDPLSFR